MLTLCVMLTSLGLISNTIFGRHKKMANHEIILLFRGLKWKIDAAPQMQ